MTTKKYLKYDDTKLDEESLRIVRHELKETEETKKKCLDILKKKLLDKGDLNPYLCTEFLLGFLRVSKFDCNKAYQRIIRYYDERKNLPDVFNVYLPSTVKVVETARQLYASPYRMRDNKSAIVILKRSEYDISKIPYELIIRGCCLIGDMILQDELNQMCGFTFILDLKCSSWSSSWSEYTPSRLKLLAHLIQKSLPLRIRGVHVVNAPPIYYLLYSIVYPFLSVKIRNRIVIHKNFDTLLKYIDPEQLPTEYDGYLEKSELINLFERIYEKEEFFAKFSKYGFMKKMK